MNCAAENGTGEYIGNKGLGNLVMKFIKCEALGQQCQSAGAAYGEVLTSALEGELGIISMSKHGPAWNSLGVTLSPVGRRPVAEFTCGILPITVRGSLFVRVPTNRMSAHETLTFISAKPGRFEDTPSEPLEASFTDGYESMGLSLTVLQDSVTSVEVNSIL
jgi:hypothetical protein